MVLFTGTITFLYQKSSNLLFLQVNCSESTPPCPSFPAIGDISRPSSANKNKICDEEPNLCGCAENAKLNPVVAAGENQFQAASRNRVSRTIETSTDTLVADGDVEERLRARSSTLVAHDATLKCNDDNISTPPITTIKEPVTTRINLSEKHATTAPSERRCKLDTRRSNNVTSARPLLDELTAGSKMARSWEVPFAAQERADAYFKNRFDTDGLPVHQTEAQRRLVAIYFTHQEQVTVKLF